MDPAEAEAFAVEKKPLVFDPVGETMSKLFDIRELPARLDEALALAASGDEIILTDGQIPKARLVPLAANAKRIAGLHPGSMLPAPDFDAPLPDDFWAGQP